MFASAENGLCHGYRWEHLSGNKQDQFQKNPVKCCDSDQVAQEIVVRRDRQNGNASREKTGKVTSYVDRLSGQGRLLRVARYERRLVTACCGEAFSERLPLFTFVQPTTHSSVCGTCGGMQVFMTLTHTFTRSACPRGHSLSCVS